MQYSFMLKTAKWFPIFCECPQFCKVFNDLYFRNAFGIQTRRINQKSPLRFSYNLIRSWILLAIANNTISCTLEYGYDSLPEFTITHSLFRHAFARLLTEQRLHRIYGVGTFWATSDRSHSVRSDYGQPSFVLIGQGHYAQEQCSLY